MPRPCASPSMLFTEVDFLERLDTTAKAGFAGVKYLSPYDVEAEVTKARLEANGLEQVLFNLPTGDWAKGECGIACHPDWVQGFREGVDKVTAYTRVLGNHQVSRFAGIRPQGYDCTSVEETFVDNLCHAADKLEAIGICPVMEMINTLDIPGLYLQSTRRALKIRDKVGSANPSPQYDTYYIQIMEGDLARTLGNQLVAVNHVQLTDNPSRYELGTGGINYRFLFEHLDRIGYQGWIGCEYKPVIITEAGLGWMKTYNVV